VLALLVYQRPNLLLLDEPTNHLDLEMRHALNLALQDFEGAMLIVSHDRHLLRSVCDRFVLVADGRARPFDGDLDDYARWMTEHRRQPAALAATASASSAVKRDSAAERRQQRQQEAERRKRLKPLRDKVSQCEKSLQRLQEEQEALQAQLADAAIYSAENKSVLNELLADQTRVKKQLAEVEEQWMEAAEALESAEQAL